MTVLLIALSLGCTGPGLGGDTGDDPGTVSTAHDNGYGPGACAGHAVTKYWDPEQDSWVEAASGSLQSVRVDFGCTDGHITDSTVSWYDGRGHEALDGLSTRTTWTWDGDQLDDQITDRLDGSDYTRTATSTRVVSGHADDLLATQDTWFWSDEDSDWYLGYERIDAWSTRVAYTWRDGLIAYTESSYWQGNTWTLEYTTTSGQSRKVDYIHDGDRLEHTTSLFYDGGTWYVGWTQTCCVSWRTYHEWDADGRLAATETRHWDDISQGWIVGWDNVYLLSVRTEYSWE